jgi:hypothetical protein
MSIDLVGITQIAERLGPPRGTVDSWRSRGQLPEPDHMLGIHPVWEWRTITEWQVSYDT